MYAMPFDGLGGEAVDMADVFPEPLNSFKAGVNAANSDTIMFWHNGAYKSLYLFSNTAVATRHGKWINPGIVPDPSWGTANQPTKLKIKGGTSFWIHRFVATGTDKTDKAAMVAALPEKTVTVSGQVVTKQSGFAEYAITPATSSAGAYTLCAAGFTAPFIPNIDLVDNTKAQYDWLADGCKGGVNAASADTLMLWYAGAYKSLYLFSNTAVPTRHNRWINPGVVPNSSWGTANQPSKAQIQPTQGFWYYRTKGQTSPLTFKVQQPYSL